MAILLYIFLMSRRSEDDGRWIQYHVWICVDCCGAVCSDNHGKSSRCLSYLSSSSLPADYPYIPRFHIIRLNPHPVAVLLRGASPSTDQCCLTAPVNQCLFFLSLSHPISCFCMRYMTLCSSISHKFPNF